MPGAGRVAMPEGEQFGMVGGGAGRLEDGWREMRWKSGQVLGVLCAGISYIVIFLDT